MNPIYNDLRLEDFDYDLPHHLIAQEPSPSRHDSRLLKLDRQSQLVTHWHFHEILQLLEPTDVLVINDTKVIPARLIAHRHSGGTVKLLLLRPEPNNSAIWQALVSPIKRLKPNERLHINCPQNDGKLHFTITILDIIEGPDGEKRLLVDLGSKELVVEILQAAGKAPLPPYIISERKMHHKQYQQDLEHYQTVFAQEPGAVAAPTAGLHFSQTLLSSLAEKGITICPLTLHVGPGTFKPIKDSIANHYVEPEVYSIPPAVCQTINDAKAQRQRIIAVGTTTCRALESATTNGVLMSQQHATTSLYIHPGYQFKMIDGLITNFHLSRSSLLLLVAAFAGRESLLHAYKIAIEQSYRFFSYGDAMLIL